MKTITVTEIEEVCSACGGHGTYFPVSNYNNHDATLPKEVRCKRCLGNGRLVTRKETITQTTDK